MTSKRLNLYLSDNDRHENEIHLNEPIKENLRTTDTSCENSHYNNRFYHELQIDDEYSFDNYSQNQKKKKQIKRRKIHQKQSQKISSTYHQQNYQKNIHHSNIPQFEQDLSSISYLTEQNSSYDSIYSKFIKNFPHNINDISREQSSSHENQNLDEQSFISYDQTDENQSQSYSKSEMINEAEQQQVQQPQQQQQTIRQNIQNKYYDQNCEDKNEQIIHKEQIQSFMKCKNTWMKFENLNRCTKRCFIKKSGMIIHPQYSQIAQDYSQLAVQGKAVLLKIKQKNHINIYSNNQQKHQNFLNEVFQDEQSHQHTIKENQQLKQQQRVISQSHNKKCEQQSKQSQISKPHIRVFEQTEQDTMGYRQKFISHL